MDHAPEPATSPRISEIPVDQEENAEASGPPNIGELATLLPTAWPTLLPPPVALGRVVAIDTICKSDRD